MAGMTANGEVFDLNGISAAHPTLPLPSYVRVTNLSNGRSLIVRVNDRGPYHGNRIIDVSMRAARLFGFHNSGIAWVKRRICRAGADRRLRRPDPGRDIAAGRAGTAAKHRQACRHNPCPGRVDGPDVVRSGAMPVSPALRLTTLGRS